eukprot:m.54688 g.54688  ORF g.54688 m.54688 type:complete len:502 (+) comp34391_c0_seq1:115-1620(+)
MKAEESTVLTRSPKPDQRISLFLVGTALSIVLGSAAQYGYQLGVINALMDVVVSEFENRTCLSSLEKHPDCSRGENLYALGVAALSIGGLFGSLLGGFPADVFGRKWSLLVNNILAVLGAVLMSLSNSYFVFVMGRVVIGFNLGISTTIGPVYLAEVAPVRLRGMIGSLFQLGTVVFIFLSELLGIRQALGSQAGNRWRYLLGVPVFLAFAHLVTSPFFPESPRYLYIMKGNKEEAAAALRRLHGASCVPAALEELKIEKEIKAASDRVTCLDLFRNPYVRFPLLVTFGLQIVRQLSGINGVINYSTKLFEQSSLPSSSILTASVGGTFILMTLISVWLIERTGRRTLLLYGFAIMMVFEICLTITFCFEEGFRNNPSVSGTPFGVLTVISTLLILAGFAIGPGPVPWLLGPELFTQVPRVRAVSLAGLFNWAGNGIVGYSFPFVFDYLYPYGMALFAGLSGLSWLFVYFYVPETKGQTVKEIASKIRKTVDKNREYMRIN